MIDHSTTAVEDPESAGALVLVGPPATGKTTLRQLCHDYGIPGIDCSDAHRAGEVISMSWQDRLDNVLEEARGEPPRLCCIEGPIVEDQVTAIRERASDTLVIRVDTHDRSTWLNRYVAREADVRDAAERALRTDVVAEIRSQADRRELLERPYPQHDVAIYNTEDARSSELAERCAHLIGICSGLGQKALETPD